MRLNFRFFRSEKPRPERGRLVVRGSGEHYQIEVKKHPAARRYTLRVRETTRAVVLTMPIRGSLRQAQIFAERNVGWIAARLKRLPESIPFTPQQIIPFRGEMHQIVHRSETRGTVWTERSSDGKCILWVAGRSPHIPRRIRDFLKREAKRELTAASHRYAEMLTVSIGAVSVRDTSSRWGSCSHSGALSFSWRLILAPPFVLDYLAAHEIAHRVELNHSKRFWKIVDRIFPNRREAEAWLRTNGSSLHRYGAKENLAAPE